MVRHLGRYRAAFSGPPDTEQGAQGAPWNEPEIAINNRATRNLARQFDRSSPFASETPLLAKTPL